MCKAHHCIRCVPKSTKNRLIMKPEGLIFVGGQAFAYDEDYPIELKGIIDKK